MKYRSSEDQKFKNSETNYQLPTSNYQLPTSMFKNFLLAFILISSTAFAQTQLGKNISCIFQDTKGNYWFGSEGEGLYKNDGKNTVLYTISEGLCNNQIRAIQEDASGNILIETGNGISMFNGSSFTTISNKNNFLILDDRTNDWRYEPQDLWLIAKHGVYRYDGNVLNYLQLPKTPLDSGYIQNDKQVSPYALYVIYKDTKGNSWFGTHHMGVCKYDGNAFTWFADKGLSEPAIRAIFEDSKGNMWFGNNGYGLYKYDGTTMIYISEEFGLENKEIKKTHKVIDKPGTVARVFAINEDMAGNIWIGTADAGVWKFNGKSFVNYTIANGLPSNTINVIYKDKKGDLLFGTQGDGVCKFNGFSFYKASF